MAINFPSSPSTNDTHTENSQTWVYNGTKWLKEGDFTETDPIFVASEANNITSTDTTNWDTAHGWGDHSVAGYEVTTNKGTANGYASLDANGKVPSTQIPPLALTEVNVVADETARLALTAQEGDVAIQTDTSTTYIHNGGSAGTNADWSTIEAPVTETDPVFTASAAFGIASGDITNWNTAFGWGDHSAAGYATTTNFTSTGIDDNATSTALTISSAGNVSMGGAFSGGTKLHVRDETNIGAEREIARFQQYFPSTGDGQSLSVLLKPTTVSNVRFESVNRTSATDSDSGFEFGGSSSTYLTISSAGNVGINESGTLKGKLHIDGGTTDIPFYFDSNVQAYPASGFGGALTYNHTAGSARVNFWNTWTGATGIQGGFDFRRLTGASSSTSLMTINGNGKVGINQAGPQYDLDVTGDIRATGALRVINIRPTTNTGGINIFGGDNTTGAANVELYGASHATQAGNAYYDAETHTFRDTSFATGLQITSDQNVRAFKNLQTKSLTIGNNLKKNIVASSNGVSTTAGATQYIKIGTIRCGISIIDIVNFGNSGYNGARLEFAMDFNNASGNDHPSVHLKRMFASDAFGELDAVYAEWDSNDSANIWIKVTTPSAAGQTYYFSIDNLGVDSDPVDIDGTIQSTSPNLTALVPDMEQSSTSTSVFNGNVGIGETDPLVNMHISGTDATLRLEDTSGAGNGGRIQWFTNATAQGTIRSGGTLGNAMAFYANGGANERMRIDPSGNVGIGVSSPAEKLQVSGDVRLGSGATDDNTEYTIKSSGQLILHANDASTQDNTFVGLLLRAGASTNQAEIELYGSASSLYRHISFKTLATERMRISGNGIVSGLWSDNSTANSSSKFVKLTQAQYDALTPDANTIYFIT